MGFEWPETELLNVAKLRSGFSFKSSNWQDEGIPVIKIANVKGGRIQLDGCGFVSKEVASSVLEWLTRDDDVLIAMTGYVGEVALIRPGERYLINQRVGRFEFLENSPVCPMFLFYYLQVPEVRAAIEEMARGSAQPNLSATDASRMKIPVAPEEVQDAVSKIGRMIDDRIDLLRQTTTTLETIAQALFKSWFVDFDPVHAKAEGREPEAMDAATAALFPSEFEDSELGLIPKGWRSLSFGDAATLSKGSVNPLTTPDTEFEHYSLPAFDVQQMPVHEAGEAIKSNKTPVPSGAVLVSKLNPHIPRIWPVGEVSANAVCSTEFLVWTPKAPASTVFVHCLASSQPFNSAMRQLVTGTSNSHQRVKPDQLKGIQLCAASDAALKAFATMATPLLQRILNNRQQAATLASLRDTLLPRLISGKLRLPEVTEAVEAALV